MKQAPVNKSMVSEYKAMKIQKDSLYFAVESKSEHILSFYDLLVMRAFTDFELTVLLFQLFYTLECFNRCGFRHNDLHFGNILVIENKNYSDKYTLFKYYDENMKLVKMKIPKIRWELRIFDFDRSQKAKMVDGGWKLPNRKVIPELSKEVKQEMYSEWTVNKDGKKEEKDKEDALFMRRMKPLSLNPQYDTFKVLRSLRKHDDYMLIAMLSTRYDLNNTYVLELVKRQIGMKVIDKESLLTYHQMIVNEDYILDAELNHVHFDYTLSDVRLPDTRTVLNRIAEEMKKTASWKSAMLVENRKQVEVYSMENIYV